MTSPGCHMACLSTILAVALFGWVVTKVDASTFSASRALGGSPFIWVKHKGAPFRVLLESSDTSMKVKANWKTRKKWEWDKFLGSIRKHGGFPQDCIMKLRDRDGTELLNMDEFDQHDEAQMFGLSTSWQCHVDTLTLPSLERRLAAAQDVAATLAKPSRHILSPGEAHVVDGFVSADELQALRLVFASPEVPWRPASINGAALDRLHRTSTADEAGRVRKSQLPEIVARTSARIQEYAATQLWLNTSLRGNHGWCGTLTTNSIMMYRYHTQGGQRMQPHTDTDYFSRCVSAALYLNDGDGGDFELYACGKASLHPGCTSRSGPELQSFYLTYPHTDKPGLFDTISKVKVSAGRLVLFLSESFHGVAPIRQMRNVLFNWMSCDADCNCEPGPCHPKCRKRFSPEIAPGSWPCDKPP